MRMVELQGNPWGAGGGGPEGVGTSIFTSFWLIGADSVSKSSKWSIMDEGITGRGGGAPKCCSVLKSEELIQNSSVSLTVT